jgi:hypothetical protein
MMVKLPKKYPHLQSRESKIRKFLVIEEGRRKKEEGRRKNQ